MGSVPVGVALIALLVTALVTIAIRYAIRVKGLTRLDRASRIVFAAYLWLFVCGFVFASVTGSQVLVDIVSVVVVTLLLPVVAFLVFAAVHARAQQGIARRRDLKLGIPHRPRPRSWSAAFLLAVYSTAAVATLVYVSASIVWAISDARRPGTASMPDAVTLLTASLVPGVIGGIALALAWKLPRDRAVKDSIDLEAGIQSRLNAEREVGRDEGRAERDL